MNKNITLKGGVLDPQKLKNSLTAIKSILKTDSDYVQIDMKGVSGLAGENMCLMTLTGISKTHNVKYSQVHKVYIEYLRRGVTTAKQLLDSDIRTFGYSFYARKKGVINLIDEIEKIENDENFYINISRSSRDGVELNGVIDDQRNLCDTIGSTGGVAGQRIILNGKLFKERCLDALNCAAKKDVRQYLNGLHLDFSTPEKLKVAGSNGWALAVNEMPVSGHGTYQHKMCVSANTLKKLCSIVGKLDNVEISVFAKGVDDSRVMPVEYEGHMLVMVDGMFNYFPFSHCYFPDTTRVIPKKKITTSVIVKRNDLVFLCGRPANDYQLCKISFLKNKMGLAIYDYGNKNSLGHANAETLKDIGSVNYLKPPTKMGAKDITARLSSITRCAKSMSDENITISTHEDTKNVKMACKTGKSISVFMTKVE